MPTLKLDPLSLSVPISKPRRQTHKPLRPGEDRDMMRASELPPFWPPWDHRCTWRVWIFTLKSGWCEVSPGVLQSPSPSAHLPAPWVKTQKAVVTCEDETKPGRSATLWTLNRGSKRFLQVRMSARRCGLRVTAKADAWAPRGSFTRDVWRKPGLTAALCEKLLKHFFGQTLIMSPRLVQRARSLAARKAAGRPWLGWQGERRLGLRAAPT